MGRRPVWRGGGGGPHAAARRHSALPTGTGRSRAPRPSRDRPHRPGCGIGRLWHRSHRHVPLPAGLRGRACRVRRPRAGAERAGAGQRRARAARVHDRDRAGQVPVPVRGQHVPGPRLRPGHLVPDEDVPLQLGAAGARAAPAPAGRGGQRPGACEVAHAFKRLCMGASASRGGMLQSTVETAPSKTVYCACEELVEADGAAAWQTWQQGAALVGARPACCRARS